MSGGGGDGAGVSYSIHEYSKFGWDIYICKYVCMYVTKEKEIHL